jgi:hypothetical protein
VQLERAATLSLGQPRAGRAASRWAGCLSLCSYIHPPITPFAGTAYSFFTSSNGRMAKQLVSILEEAQQPVPPELRQFAMTSGGPQSKLIACPPSILKPGPCVVRLLTPRQQQLYSVTGCSVLL